MAKKEKSSPNQELVLVVTSNNQEEAKEISQSLGNLFSAKPNLKLLFFAEYNLQDEISSIKTFKNFETNIAFAKKLSDLFVYLDEKTEAQLVFTKAVSLNNAGAILQEASKLEDHAITRIVPSSESGKIPFANRVHNLTRQLFSGTQSFDEENLFYVLDHYQYNRLSKSLFVGKASPKSFFRQLEKASFCSDIDLHTIAVKFNQLTKQKLSIGTISSEKIEGLKNRLTYMVGESVLEIRKGEGFTANGGFYRLSFLSLSFLLMFLMPILSLGFGITWDEINIIVYAEDILDYFFSFGADKDVLNTSGGPDYNVLINYGLFFDSFAALVNKFTPFDIYQTRHMLNALVGFTGIFFTGLLAREAGSWRTGFIALVIMALSPYYFGHAMNNPKDIPFAAGFITSIYFLVKYLKQLPKPSFSSLLLLTISIGLVNTIRIGGLILIGFLGLATGIQWLITAYKEKFSSALKLILPYAKYFIGITLGSYIIGVLPWPYAHQDPINNPFEALKFFTNFSGVTIYEIFEGERIYMNEVPWYYIPKWLLIGNPLFSVLGLCLAILPLALFKRSQMNTAIIWFVAFSLVFPIAYAVYGDSTLYNGWRHFIFVYPSMAVLAAVGWSFLVDISNKKFMRIGVAVVFSALTINTLVWMVKYHPNEYVYFNELVGGYDGAYGEYELDTYGNGIRGAFEKLVELYPEAKQQETMVAINMTGWDWQNETTKDFFGKNIKGTWTRDYERHKKPYDFAIFFPRTYSPAELKNGAYPPKGTVYTEDIEGKPLYAIIKRENDFMVEGHKAAKNNNHQAAIANFEKALAYDPMNEEATRNLGLAYLNIGNNEKASEWLQKAIEVNPNSNIAWNYLGIYYTRINNLQKAVECYQEAINNKINYSYPYIQLANIYMQSSMFTDALNYYEKALERMGRFDVQILNSMGVCYLNLGDNQNAINYLSTAVQQNPNYADSYQNLGFAYQQLGDNNKAQEYFQKARQLGGR